MEKLMRQTNHNNIKIIQPKFKQVITPSRHKEMWNMYKVIIINHNKQATLSKVIIIIHNKQATLSKHKLWHSPHNPKGLIPINNMPTCQKTPRHLPPHQEHRAWGLFSKHKGMAINCRG